MAPSTLSQTDAAPTQAAAPRRTTRTRLFLILGAVIVVCGLIYLLVHLLAGGGHVSTDDAYVNADVAQVAPLVSGPVLSVPVTDTQAVKAGQTLVVLDPSDAKLALANAEAQLGLARRKVQGYFATDTALAGQVSARVADIQGADAAVKSAQSDLQRASVELNRRQALGASGAVSGDELTDAENRFNTAQAALTSARAQATQAKAQRIAAVGQRAANTVLVEGGGVDANPEVAAAQAQVDQAKLDLDRTTIRAPFDGVVARKTVQVGQRVQVGAPLMSVVPVQAVYVDANFKEVQLKRVRPGQPVVLTADIYGGAKYHGHVVGLAGGTGSAFSVIPAQNASGNWIKIVQRLPVRVALDPQELKARPLRIGLSMKVDIDVNAPAAR